MLGLLASSSLASSLSRAFGFSLLFFIIRYSCFFILFAYIRMLVWFLKEEREVHGKREERQDSIRKRKERAKEGRRKACEQTRQETETERRG